MNFASNFALLRRWYYGYSQEYVAEQILNIKQQHYSMRERGKLKFKPDEKEKLARLTDFTVEELETMEGLKIEISFQGKSVPPPAPDHLKALQDEVAYLREQNMRLMEMLGK